MPRPFALLVTPALDRSGFGWSETQLVAIKIVTSLGCAVIAIALGLVLPIGPLTVVAAAYGGFVAPTLIVDRSAAARRDEAAHGLVTLVEWVEALVAAGRPVETAIVASAARGVRAALVDDALAAAARSYALGAPLFGALAREADRRGLEELAQLAQDLDRARELGRGALTVLADERERVRAAERARLLDAAGRVEGRLLLVLVLCYMPALMLLVVIPLFVGLVNGLFV